MRRTGEDGDVDVIDADDCEFATTLMTNTRIVLIMTMLMTGDGGSGEKMQLLHEETNKHDDNAHDSA